MSVPAQAPDNRLVEAALDYAHLSWPRRPKPFWERFKREGECLFWQGRRDKDGYGLIKQCRDGRSVPVRVHRLIYMRLNGPLSSDQPVCHSCDQPPCGEPSHLFEGTTAINMADKVAKGRHVSGMALHPERAAKGEQNGSAKLSAADVLEIRRRRALGHTQALLAKTFEVSVSAIKSIDNRRTWAWL